MYEKPKMPLGSIPFWQVQFAKAIQSILDESAFYEPKNSQEESAKGPAANDVDVSLWGEQRFLKLIKKASENRQAYYLRC